MIDASSLSVISSLKVDSEDRQRNLEWFLDYFQTYCFNAEIILVEQGAVSHLANLAAGSNKVIVKHLNDEGVHCKTRNLNVASHLASRAVIYMCDVDVFVPESALASSLGMFSQGAKFVAPYNGVMAEVSKKYAESFCDFKSLVRCLPHFSKEDASRPFSRTSDCYPIYGGLQYDATGGALLYDRAAFVDVGCWNPNIFSYGFEDMEFFERAQKLGHHVQRVIESNSYHFEHARHFDSYYNNFYRANEEEYQRVCAMTPAELRRYVDKGFRLVELDPLTEFTIENTTSAFSLRVKPSDLVDLSDSAIVIVVKLNSLKPVSGLHAMLRFLEEKFNGYEIHLIEVQNNFLKSLGNKKNIQYKVVQSDESLDQIAERERSTITRTMVDVFIWSGVAAPNEVVHHYSQLL